MRLSISSPNPGISPPHGAADIVVETFPILVTVAFKGIESHSQLFDDTTAQYLAKMWCQIPY